MDLEPTHQPHDLRAWLTDIQKRGGRVRFTLSNGQTRRGSLVNIMADCILLGPEDGGPKLPGIMIDQIVTIDPE